MTLDNLVSLPKGELHVHLNGLIPTGTVLELFERENTRLPEGFNPHIDLIRTQPCNSLIEYLKPWEAFRLFPTDRRNLKFIIESCFISLKKQNIKFVEIRNTVIYIALLNNISTSMAMNWLLEDLDEFSEKYDIIYGLILTISRGEYSSSHLEILLSSYENLGKPSKIIGLDLAGNEDTIVNSDLGKQFERAKKNYGLNITIHAGETGIIQNVFDAINIYKADRIGHGTAASKSLELMEFIHMHDICIEICPISNLLTGAVKNNNEHSFINFLKYDVPFVICSDNPGIHQSSLSHDYLEFYKNSNNSNVLNQMFELQKKYSFLNI